MSTQQLVSPEKIQEELTRIWESLEGTNKMRACLFNLVIYSQNNPRAAYIHQIAQKVIDKFPSRIIFVLADKNDGQDYLKTSVSVVSAQSDIACDLIQIEVAGEKQKRIPYVILPHLVPDLPVYLVWADDPVQENPISHQLEKYATRLIFDSETTDNLPMFAEAILEHKTLSHGDIADLNWARLEGWRDMMTSFFHSQEGIEQLERLKKVEITYNCKETEFFCHTKIQALYMKAWLITRVGTLAEIILTPKEEANLGSGRLLGIEMITTEEEHFSFQRDQTNPGQINIQCSDRDRCAMPTRFLLGKAESGDSLVREITHKGTSEHYLDVLNYIKAHGNA